MEDPKTTNLHEITCYEENKSSKWKVFFLNGKKKEKWQKISTRGE